INLLLRSLGIQKLIGQNDISNDLSKDNYY
ncbi:hypothetical protein SNEBB_010078, partial [Seison nebaliae]